MLEYQRYGKDWTEVDNFYTYLALEQKVKSMESWNKITFRIDGKLYREFNGEFKSAFEADRFWGKLK